MGTEVAVALIGITFTAVMASVTAMMQYRAKASIEAVNNSVNHVKPGEPTLYQAVLNLYEHVGNIDKKQDQILEWKSQYQGGPLDSGEKVVEFVKICSHNFRAIDSKLDKLDRKIDITIAERGCPFFECKDPNCGRTREQIAEQVRQVKEQHKPKDE